MSFPNFVAGPGSQAAIDEELKQLVVNEKLMKWFVPGNYFTFHGFDPKVDAFRVRIPSDNGRDFYRHRYEWVTSAVFPRDWEQLLLEAALMPGFDYQSGRLRITTPEVLKYVSLLSVLVYPNLQLMAENMVRALASTADEMGLSICASVGYRPCFANTLATVVSIGNGDGVQLSEVSGEATALLDTIGEGYVQTAMNYGGAIGVNVEIGDYQTRFALAVGCCGPKDAQSIIATVHSRHLVVPLSNTLGELERLRTRFAIKK